ncbi:cytochrome c oxidase assembly protein [Nemania abortiva]|nr:cytochrome c oxidase assembly protein [Nemania abortiva]
MSRASKLTLLGTSLFAATTVVFVHFQQKFEKEVCYATNKLTAATRQFAACSPRAVLLTFPYHVKAMHQGVVRDLEQQRLKRERQLDFDMQRALEEEYKKGQTVSRSTDDIPDRALPNR